MKIETRINYITFLILGLIFILVGQALNELDIIDTINAASAGEGNDFDIWYQFLLPWVGDESSGLPTPW
ncbi:MAG: hypothetical protein HeimC2_07830 [Candidatus Heimdallarchaeota archaeon LC_2]|nr:MAG: hypothetical protein HeimC2_07830 [Candidatus Heimdallarchaeota archaeon LC_2]